tara:strand:- start:146 stop:478 length:333 start_codon:yes stop_codon:yes gene_type:complete
MARRYIKVTTIKVFPNDDHKRGTHGNGNWKPFVDGSPADIHLRGDSRYSVAVFENDDNSLSIAISEVRDYESKDNIADGISQGGLKPVGDAINQKYQPAVKETDDDIPFL